MSRCPTFTFQVSIMTKWLAKHISTKISLKITIRKGRFTLTLVDLEYETSISIWEFEMMNVLNDIFDFISARYTIKFTEQKWNTFINGLWHINFYMNFGISNWHNSSFESTKLKFFTLFQFLTRLLTSKHLKIFSTYLVGRNVAIWETCFSATQNAKKENSWNIKSKCVTNILLTVRSSSMKDYTCHYVGST